MNLNDIIEFCKAQALSYKLYPSEESNYRWFCREYSKTFHTPLDQVMSMDPEHVILCILEENLDHKRISDREDFESIVKDLRILEDPDYDSNQEKELDEFVAGIEEWDKNRNKSGTGIPTKNINKFKDEKLPEAPKKGFVNFSYLEDSQNEK